MASILGRAIPLWTRLFPKSSEPRGLRYSFPGTITAEEEITIQLTSAGLDFINGVFIDNSQNSTGFRLINRVTGQIIFVAANSQANMALITAKTTDNIQFTCQSTGGVDVPIIFRNTEPTSDGIYATTDPGTLIGAITVQGQITSLPLAKGSTSRNATLAVALTSQQLMPANASRRRFIIQNPFTSTGQGIASVEPAYFRFASAAGVDNGTSFELYPGASYDSAAGALTNEAIFWIATTINHRLIATEL